MKIIKALVISLFFAAPAMGAADPGPILEAGGQNAVTVIKTVPLLDLMAERTVSSKVLTLGATSFLAAAVLDDNWDVYLQIKEKGSRANPGVWGEAALKAGVIYKYSGGEINIIERNGFISVTDSGGASAQTAFGELFDLLYANSTKAEFGGLVTYAFIRNLTPLTNNEGTIALRMGSNGAYYYSLTPDDQVAVHPRWLLAINGVLYGLKATDTETVFVSKPIEAGAAADFLVERALWRY